MTDAPFPETLRSFSKLCGGGNEDVAAAIEAALAEIDRLTAHVNELIDVAHGLADQQAISDDWWIPQVRAAILAIGKPAKETP